MLKIIAHALQKKLLTALMAASICASLLSCDILYPEIVMPSTEAPTEPTPEVSTEETTAAPPTEPTTDAATEPVDTTPEPTEPPDPYADYQELLPANIKMTTPRKEAIKYLEELAPRDFAGLAFTIATTDSTKFEAEAEGSLVTQARYFRNQLVERKYNVEILTLQYSNAEFRTAAKTAYLAGDFFADIVSCEMSEISALIHEDLLVNLRSVPFMNLRKPYYDQSAIKAVSAGKQIYAVFGGITASPEKQWALIYNRDTLRELGLTDPYTTIKAGGTWDLAEYSAICAKAMRDVNGDGRMGEGDIYGHAATVGVDRYIDILFAGSGISYLNSDNYAAPRLVYGTSRAQSLTDALHAFFIQNQTKIPETDTPQYPVDQFRLGKAAFLTSELSVIPLLQDTPFDWGVLPIPKFDAAQQGYSCYADISAPGAAIVKGIYESETSGILIEALSAASYKHINDEFINEYMNYYMRSYDAVEMLGLVLDSPGYDMAHVLGAGNQQVADATYGFIRGAVRSGGDFLDRYSGTKKAFDEYSAQQFK